MKVKTFIIASALCLVGWLAASFMHDTGSYSYNTKDDAPLAKDNTSATTELITSRED